jgi:hypothetical protein
VDQVLLRFSDPEIDSLAGTIADELFAAIYACAVRQYPWDKPVTPSMEALGDKVLRIAAAKFYERCS